MAKNVTGVRETKAAFRQIKAGLDVPMRTSLRYAARPMLAEAKKTAPVDKGVLKRSVKLARIAKLPPGLVGYVIGIAGRARIYAHLAEWGVPGEYEGSRFMTRAFLSKRQEVLQRFAAHFPAQVEKRLHYLARKAGAK
jgi:hypothetical protein